MPNHAPDTSSSAIAVVEQDRKQFEDAYTEATVIYSLLRRRREAHPATRAFLPRTLKYMTARRKGRQPSAFGGPDEDALTTAQKKARISRIVDELFRRADHTEGEGAKAEGADGEGVEGDSGGGGGGGGIAAAAADNGDSAVTAAAADDADGDGVGESKPEDSMAVDDAGTAADGDADAGAASEEEDDPLVARIPYKVIEPVTTSFEYLYGEDESLRQVQVLATDSCPWCEMDCLTRTGLMLHLNLCHDRFEYEFTLPGEDDFRVAVIPSDRWRQWQRRRRAEKRKLVRLANSKRQGDEDGGTGAAAGAAGENGRAGSVAASDAGASSLGGLEGTNGANDSDNDGDDNGDDDDDDDGDVIFQGTGSSSGDDDGGGTVPPPPDARDARLPSDDGDSVVGRARSVSDTDEASGGGSAPGDAATADGAAAAAAPAVKAPKPKLTAEEFAERRETAMQSLRSFDDFGFRISNPSRRRTSARDHDVFAEHAALFELTETEPEGPRTTNSAPVSPVKARARGNEPRQYFDSTTFMPMPHVPAADASDSDDEVDTSWYRAQTDKEFDELQDVNSGERETMRAWNDFIETDGPRPGDAESQFVDVCQRFIDTRGAELWLKCLRNNFLQHLFCLVDFGLLRPEQAVDLIARFDRIPQ